MKILLLDLLDRLGKYSRAKLIVLITLFSTVVSVAVVASVLLLVTGRIDPVPLTLSVIMPLLMTPGILAPLLKLVLKLEYYKHALEKAVEINREKDMMLFEQERFALMGEMLSNISHQWRQPLNAINLTLLSAKVAQATGRLDDDALDQAFETIEQNIHHLSGTIEDFRSFFQNKSPTKMVPLHQIVYELNSIITPTLKAKRIALEIAWDDDLIHRLQLATAVSQVLLNLISNAKDALATSEREAKQIHVAFRLLPENIAVSVTDNGPGIDPAIKPKIFDPYFTTKGSLKGSGIGLHMSRQIVEKIFGGAIAVTSSSEGSCFTLTLPYSEHCRLSE